MGTQVAQERGGVSYTIPIDILKGTNGMEPKITLSYNSQGAEGIAGFGWNLSAKCKYLYLSNLMIALMGRR